MRRARIAPAAEGNPLFAEQMLSMMIDSGQLELADGRWVAAADAGDLVVPPTIQALLAARLDGLSAPSAPSSSRASVIGLVFPQSARSRSSRPRRCAIACRRTWRP